MVNSQEGTIRFQCECGKEIAVSRQFAGRRAKCKACGRSLTIPGDPAAKDSDEPPEARAIQTAANRSPAAPDAQPAAPPPQAVQVRPAAQVPLTQVVIQVPQGFGPGAAGGYGQGSRDMRMEMASPTPTQEMTIWQGRTSLACHAVGMTWTGLWALLWLILLFSAPGILAWAQSALSAALPDVKDAITSPHVKPIYLSALFALLLLWALVRLAQRVLAYLNTYFVFTNQRIRIRQGILSRQFNQIELFRVKDLAVMQPFFGRLFGYATVRIVSSDRLARDVELAGLPGGMGTAEKIRQAAQRARADSGLTTIGE